MAVVETGSSDDIQAQVLQTTLAEIEASRQKATGSDSTDDDVKPRNCCVICLDSISDSCTALPCNHAHFDFCCLLRWLEQHPNCPLCKANVYKVRYAVPQDPAVIYRVPNAVRTRDSAGRGEHTVGSLRDSGRRQPRLPPSESEAVRRRRHIYRHQLYSLRSNRISGYQPLPTPAQLSSTPHLLSRARLWIRRELQVFLFLSSDPDADSNDHHNNNSHNRSARTLRRRNNAEFLLEYVVAILKTVDIQGSMGQAEAMLADFLGHDHARLFLHELRCWLRSPAPSLAAWDREVRYPEVTRNIPVVRRGSVAREDGSEGERGDQGERAWSSASTDGRGRGGASWQDRAGDHWRADSQTSAASSGERRKRKLREDDDETGKGRANRTGR
ncbi:uncharacterized protein B0T15DRAFT_533525 [Chaetomium strumarium]|uniref:RING-type E3 ubiquitin transferase n=1 Tax=Chaetomium strumarium TaxID=1170767 RepID=A0AAJ0GTE8_9PEZI|nr:hypothetical protein B0T15DRAFT_533525 [Chaetomium strumarium]